MSRVKPEMLTEGLELVCNPYNAADASGRVGAMVKTHWRGEFATIVNDRNLKALYLNSAHGWRGTDYSFLSTMPQLEEIAIIQGADSQGIRSVEVLENLKDLSLEVQTKESVDFSQIKSLTECYLGYWPGASSITRCKSLESLYLNVPRMKDFRGLGELVNLSELIIGNSPIKDLSWLPRLAKLKRLELLNCRSLENFQPLSACTGLEHLVVDGSSRLNALDFVSKLSRIKELRVSNNREIQSLDPVGDLHALESFSFGGRTEIVDGQLDVLFRLPRLRRVMFNGRRHYSHSFGKKQSTWFVFEPGTLGQYLKPK